MASYSSSDLRDLIIGNMSPNCLESSSFIKAITKFWYGVMNLVQMKILESICNFTIFNDRCRCWKSMKLKIINSLCCIALPRPCYYFSLASWLQSPDFLFPLGNYITELHILRFSLSQLPWNGLRRYLKYLKFAESTGSFFDISISRKQKCFRG